MRTLTLHDPDGDRTYHGFDRALDPPPPYLAHVTIPGEGDDGCYVDVWAADEPGVVDELRRCYRDSGREVGVRVYQLT